MFGLISFYHPNLRRLLTDYGFSDYPLKKFFPVVGFKEVYYSSYLSKIKYINV